MLYIVCCVCWQPNTDHCFGKFPILNNHNLLESQYVYFVQFLQQTFNSQKQAEASLNLLVTTEEQQQANSAASIMHLFKDPAKTMTINHQHFPTSKE